MEPGIYTLPEEEYFADPAVSNSDLKLVRRSPAHFYSEKRDPDRVQKEPSPQMKAGKCLHCAILEPWDFDSRHAVLPPDAPNRPSLRQINAKNPSKESIQAVRWWNDWNSLHGDKEIITDEQCKQYKAIGSLIRNHPELMGYMLQGKAEQSVFAKDPETGVMCKCRPDWMTRIANLNVVIDFKSTDDARPHMFQRTAYNFEYFKGAAYYSDVIRWSGLDPVDLFLLVAFERDPPFAIKVYEIQEAELDRGREQYRPALNLFAYCQDTGEWPSYDTSIEVLEFPVWAKD